MSVRASIRRVSVSSQVAKLASVTPLKDAHLLLRATLVLLLIAFAAYVAVDRGLFALVFAADRSYLSSIILVIYVVATTHWFFLARALNRERADFIAFEAEPTVIFERGGLIAHFVRELTAANTSRDVLVNALNDDLSNRHALGHLLADVLLKLGLLGTIIGFILMLIPVGEMQDVDASSMKSLLAAMSGGMAIALFTTLTGLVTSLLLRLQYHILDSSLVELGTRLSVALERSYGDGAADNSHA